MSSRNGVATATLENVGRVAVLTIRHDPVNTLHPNLVRALADAVCRVRDGHDYRCMVLTGAGRYFSAGGDIDFFETLDRRNAEPYVFSVQAMQNALQLLPIPVLAAVNGPALGGGFELAMACDIRIAGADATFGLPEVGLGIIPAAGGTQHLPRLVGPGRARRLLFSGEQIDAVTAERYGIVDELVSPGTSVDAAVRLGTTIAANAPLAIAAAKRAVHLGSHMSAGDGQRLEATLFAELAGTEDLVEGVKAFHAKRTATFIGR